MLQCPPSLKVAQNISTVRSTIKLAMRTTSCPAADNTLRPAGSSRDRNCAGHPLAVPSGCLIPFRARLNLRHSKTACTKSGAHFLSSLRKFLKTASTVMSQNAPFSLSKIGNTFFPNAATAWVSLPLPPNSSTKLPYGRLGTRGTSPLSPLAFQRLFSSAVLGHFRARFSYG